MYLYTLTKETTPQQFFDAIKEGCKQRNFPSFIEDVTGHHGISCMYRNGSGKCCVVGMFIPDDKYNERMEKTAALQVVKEYNLVTPEWLIPELLNVLQGIHDRMCRSEWNDSEFLVSIKDTLEKYVKVKLD
jgi:hypothetical protein